MMWAGLTLALCLSLATPAWAQAPAIPSAETAAEDLRNAIDALKAAEGSRDRVAALTDTIHAYESGLAALREALRRAAGREAEISAAFQDQRNRIGQLLAVMAMIEAEPAPALLLHPQGALGAVRSGIALGYVAPALQAEADIIKAQLAELERLQTLQADTALTLQKGLQAVRSARTALSQAVQNRTDLPQRFLADPEELTALLDSADSLDSFAAGLSSMETDIGAPMDDFEGAKGSLPLPVRGTVLREAGEADAAGIKRPGVIIMTEPGALVTAPWPATIRYRGPLLDYGNVMIIEPASGYLLILAGLDKLYGDTGDVVVLGAPLGLMGGGTDTLITDPQPIAADVTETAGARRRETLYMELRQGKVPVDPGPWFTKTRED